MEETISVVELFQILKKKALLIIMMTITGIGLAAGVTFFLITPIYDSAAQLIVQNKQAEGANINLQNDINGNVLLINTYKDMIKGDIVIDAVQKELQNEYQYTYSNNELKKSSRWSRRRIRKCSVLSRPRQNRVRLLGSRM